ncbi:MAG: hypothetical protein HY231_05005 [Acidobacteria bacterium]|nr:hypothetical protein [Acidobacteriota bacterium]
MNGLTASALRCWIFQQRSSLISLAISTLGMIERQLVEVRCNHSKREPQRQPLISVVQFEIVQSRVQAADFFQPP